MNTINTSNTVGLWVLIFPILMFAFAIWALIFWIRMLIHVAKHDVENKVVWVILIVFTGIIGALIYYFIVKREFAKQVPLMPTQPAPPTPTPVTPPTPPTPPVTPPTPPVTPPAPPTSTGMN